MGLGAVLVILFLIFVLTMVYAIWCRQARDRWAPSCVSASPKPNRWCSEPLSAPLRASEEAGQG